MRTEGNVSIQKKRERYTYTGNNDIHARSPRPIMSPSCWHSLPLPLPRKSPKVLMGFRRSAAQTESTQPPVATNHQFDSRLDQALKCNYSGSMASDKCYTVYHYQTGRRTMKPELGTQPVRNQLFFFFFFPNYLIAEVNVVLKRVIQQK